MSEKEDPMPRASIPEMLKSVPDDLLGRLGVNADLRAPTRRLLETVARNPAGAARTGELVAGFRGRIGRYLGQQTLLSQADLAGLGGVEGAVPLAALILSAPDVEEFWRGLGYPEPIIADTLADLGRQIRKTIAVTGRFGLGQASWLEMIWRGGFAQLGRLQFELRRSTLGREGAGDGPLVLSAHIAPIGSLAPDLVAASLARAHRFFTTHFPELAGEPGAFDIAFCESWLLDTELMGLMPGSNMDSFARLWTVWERPVSDGSGIFFGFDRPFADAEKLPGILDDLPYDSRLHRAMIDLWRRGGHVHSCSGWLTLPR